MNKYYGSVLNEENTALCCPKFKNGHRMQKLVAGMTDDLAPREWELDALKDIKCIDNHQRPIRFWSREIIKSCYGGNNT